MKRKLHIIDILILLVLVAAIAVAVVKVVGRSGADGADAADALSEPNLRFEMTTDELSKTLADSIQAALTADKTKVGNVEAEAGRIYNGDKLIDACVTKVTVGLSTRPYTLSGAMPPSEQSQVATWPA